MYTISLVISLTIALLTAYSPMWTGKAFSLLYSDQIFSVSRSDWKSYQKNCKADDHCAEKYIIPEEQLHSFKERFKNKTIANGIGQLSGAAVWKCTDKSGNQITLFSSGDTSDSVLRTSYYDYSVGILGLDSCSKSLAIEIEADRTNLNKKSGWLRGSVMFGDPDLILKYKDIYNFFNNDFRFVTALLLAFSLLILLSTKSLQKRIRILQISPSIVLWLLSYLALSSSRLEMFLMGASPVLKILQPNFYLTLMFAVSLSVFLQRKHKVRFEVVFFALNLLLLFALRNEASAIYRIEIVSLSLFALYSTVVKRETKFLIFIGLFYHDYVLLLNPILDAFPSSALIFLAIFSMCQVLKQIRVASVLLAVSDVKPDGDKAHFESFLKAVGPLLKQLQIEHFSIFQPTQDQSGGTVHVLEPKNTAKSVALEKTPPFFGYANATKETLLHIDSESSFYTSLKLQYGTEKTDRSFIRYKSRWFSIYSVEFKSESLLVSFAGYPKYYASTRQGKALFKVISETIVETIVKCLQQIQQHQTTKILETIENLNALLNNDEIRSAHDLLDRFSAENGFKCFMIRVMPESREMRLEHSFGYSLNSGIDNLFVNRSLNPKNLIGPLANTFFNNRVTVISNGKTLLPFSSQLVSDFIINSDSNSIACIPISVTSEEGRVVWIQSERESEFNITDKQPLALLAAQIEKCISGSRLSEIQQVVDEIIPAEVLQAYQREGRYESCEVGHLIMFDLRGSTKLSASIGYDKFNELMGFAQAFLSAGLREQGWLLKERTWDALYYFRRDDGVGDMQIDELETVEGILSALAKQISSQPAFAQISPPLFRTVVHYGELQSVLVKEGMLKFKMVGSMMAEISKLEALAKNDSNSIFISGDAKPTQQACLYLIGQVDLGRVIELYALPIERKKVA